MTASRCEALASASEFSTERLFAPTPDVLGPVIAATAALDSPRVWEDNSYLL